MFAAAFFRNAFENARRYFRPRANIPLTTEEVLREEAAAIRGADLGSLSGKELNRALNGLESTALCLSGGGIRSASFALGVIQALAVHPHPSKTTHVGLSKDSWLAKINYLSTVSGGGYIGGWLSAWLFHAHGDGGGGWDAVWRALVGERGDPIEEPDQISWLRRYSNYLTPKLGIASADTWADIALIMRNMLLNWLVIIPVLCAALLVLKLVALFDVWIYQTDARYSANLLWVFAGLGCLSLLLALRFTTRNRPTRGAFTADQGAFLRRGLAPAAIAALLFVFAASVGNVEKFVRSDLLVAGQLQARGVLILMGIGLAVYVLAWIVALPKLRADSFQDWLLWAVSGAVYGALIATGLYLYFTFGAATGKVFQTPQMTLLVCGVPWILGSQLVAEMIFVGLTSYEDRSDSDREWLGRAAGWYLAWSLAWFVLMSLVLLGSYWAADLYGQITAWVTTGVAGSATAWLSKAKSLFASKDSKTGKVVSAGVVMTLAALITAIALIVAVSGVLDAAMLGGSLVEWTRDHLRMSVDGYAPWSGIGAALLALLIVVIVGLGASARININRFSLHALYRNRLIRAFLGASNPERRPNPFTDFDENDNVRVYDLWPEQIGANEWQKVGPANWRPFHLINIALNVVSTKNLAWQQRKAEPFSVTALHSGSSCVGYRYSSIYGDNLGISLGTAVAISGAAASPNMGYHSSAPLAFLMTLFNVRLGWWLGNPGPRGNSTYPTDGPKTAVIPLLYEIFGLTTEDWKYVYLSDGGHFENLGFYEMVRRRCRYIVVSDAGCDPSYAFDDLGNAVRKIYLDLGVNIRFFGLTELKPRPTAADNKAKPVSGTPETPLYAIGVIDYPAADGGSEEGIILYVKAGYQADQITNVGVRNYATANPEFPHESTGDQFFSESQFESYRALGFEIMDTILSQGSSLVPDPTHPTLSGVMTALRDRAVNDGKP